jgi:hypothetical protein
MPKDTIFINALVPVEDDMALRFIGASLRLSRSEVVRIAIHEFIERNKEVVEVSSLPHPKGAEVVPVLSVKQDNEVVRYPVRGE